MDRQQCQKLLQIIRTEREKQAQQPAPPVLAPDPLTAIDNATTQHLRSEALKRIGNYALAGLGAGAAGGGLYGLLNMLRSRPQSTRSGPATLAMPYPVDPDDAPSSARRRKIASSFLGGGSASSVAGIPWFGPAAVAATLGGGLVGWKGVDSLLQARRQRDKDEEMRKTKEQFQQALLSQYDKPLSSKTAGDQELGRDLDNLYDLLTEKLTSRKLAIDLGDISGRALGGYGIYAGLSGLLTGALVYDKARKRSRQAVIEKALQRRQREQFAEQPTAIYATPVPVAHTPKVPFKQEMQELEAQPV